MLALAFALLSAPDLFGTAACGLDDVNGDGVPDLAVGDPSDVPWGWPYARPGKVRIVSGADGGLLCELEGESAGDEYGSTLAAVGDLDGDGLRDFLAGATRSARTGRAYVEALSSSGGVLYTLELPADGKHYPGKPVPSPALAALGDVDADGDVDWAVSSAYDTSANERGIVRVIDGASGALLLEVRGEAPEDRYGGALCGIGDVDGDGKADLAVATAQWIDRQQGYVHLISPARGIVLKRIQPGDAPSTFGTSLSAILDLDGDGAKDLLVTDHTQVQAFSSATGQRLRRWCTSWESSLQHYPRTVAGLPDMQGDGVPDLLVGSRSISDPCAWLLSGEQERAVWDFRCDPWLDSNVGALVAAADDLDGDGLPEAMVGGATAVGGDYPGVLYVLSGSSGRKLLELRRRPDPTRAPAARTPAVSLSATLIDEGGRPLEGVRVFAHVSARPTPRVRVPGEGSFSGVTDAEGFVKLELDMRLTFSGPGWSQSYSSDVLFDEHGGRASRLVVEASDPAGRRGWRTEAANVDLRAGLDLGRIQVPRVADVTVLVADARSVPIQGALVITPSWVEPGFTGDLIRSLPSGPDGLAVISGVPAGAKDLCVVAAGHVPGLAPVPADRAQPRLVTLKPATSLEVRAHARQGVHPEDLELELLAQDQSVELFSSPGVGVGLAFWSSAPSVIYPGGRQVAFPFDAEGRLKLSNLAPYTLIHARLFERDPSNTSAFHPAVKQIGRTVSLRLRPGEQRTLDLP
jgi:hypothetical protein